MSVYSGCLHSTVVNVSGHTKYFGFLPPHGVTLAPNATFTYIGSPTDWLQRQYGMTRRRVKAFEECLDKGWITIRQTPAVILYDPTATESKAFILDDATLGTAIPCWLYGVANTRKVQLQNAINAYRLATGSYPTSSIASQIAPAYIAAIPTPGVGAQAAANGILIDNDAVPTVNEASAGNGWVYSPSSGLIAINATAATSPYAPMGLSDTDTLVSLSGPVSEVHGPYDVETQVSIPPSYEYQVHNLGPDEITVLGEVVAPDNVVVAPPLGNGNLHSAFTISLPVGTSISVTHTPAA